LEKHPDAATKAPSTDFEPSNNTLESLSVIEEA
jgi:hypothetical protein